MAWKFFLSLAVAAFVAILFRLFSRRGDKARSTGKSARRRRARRRRARGNDGTARGASSTDVSTEVQEVATSSGYDSEVFLSFRGPDTRAGFIDFLYTIMIDMGIRVYKDDKDLPKGEDFGPELLRAIEQSKISMPIFSKGYASSVWCLKELAKMVECQKTKGQKIIPIFYDVAPSVVRYQTGIYAEAFLSHEGKQRYGKDTIREWKASLSAVGAINGWDLHSNTDRREGEFARKVTQKVFSELKKAYLAVSGCLVSVDNHVDAIMEMIGVGTSETRTIGIHGMGGIGKTTTAKLIFNKLSHDFENCCFLSDVRETSKNKGIHCLQNDLISDILKTKCIDIKDIDEGTQMIKDRLFNKRVLLLLDDVEEENHINALVGERDWLGRGSKIIITTRNKDILEVPEVDYSYELSTMDVDQSLQLFSRHAFRKDYPLDEYIDQSQRAIGIARGLPLALEVIGSLLCRTKKEKWDLTLKKLENVPHAAVQSKLKISYDALDVRQQHIFLDIACLFVGYEKDIVVHFWDESKFPEEAMEVLQNMSLIKIEENNLMWMHDQLRDLGREIVRQESKMKIEKQSRMWDPEEALDLLRRPEGKTKVEALRLHFDHERQYRFTYKDFEIISNLRFLQVDDWKECFRAEERLLWHESPLNVLPIDNFQENSDLLPQLRWLSWRQIPPTFKITNFSMKNVVILDLSMSKITHAWKGWSHMKVMKNLKVMNLSNCIYLDRTPDFSAHSKLERLILMGCSKLVEIDKSICQLKSLVLLNISLCMNLRRLPDEIGRDLASLKYLYMSRCDSLEGLPNTIGNLKSLNTLYINATKIKELPSALWTIEKLDVIEVQMMPHLDMEIGNCIYRNQSLRILKLSCNRIHVVPRLPESLTILKLSKLYMNTFPDLSNLTNLKELGLEFDEPRDSDGESDGESDGLVEEDLMPLGIGNLSKLESLSLSSPYVTTIPIDMRSLLPQLKVLSLCWCPNLRCLPSLPSSLSELDLNSGCVTTIPIDVRSLLPQLRSLKLRCPNLRCLPSLPSNLSSLYLNSRCMTTLPMDMSSLLPRLQSLELECPNLRCLPSLPSSLLELDLRSGCVAALPMDMSSLLPRLQSLQLACPNLRCLPSLPSSLRSLYMVFGKSCCSMEDLSNLKTLSFLFIADFAISEIRGLDGLENLQQFVLWKLQQVEISPDLSNLNQLRQLEVFGCGNLVEIQGELPPSLEKLVIQKCKSLQKLPDLSSLKGLREVEIEGCGKLNVEAISSLCSEKGVKFKGDDSKSGCEFDYESGGEDDESGCECDCGSEGEDGESGCEFEYGSEGEDDESGCEIEYGSEGEDDESGCEIEYGSEGEDSRISACCS